MLSAVGLRADDWPGFRGSNRDGICREKGLFKEWSKDGPKLLWKVTGMGIGNSAPSVVGNVLCIMGEKDDQEWVLALDVSREGKDIGLRRSALSATTATVFLARGRRPPSTAIRPYTLGIAGDIVCMDVNDGRIIWHYDVVKDFGGKVPKWGYAESVLVDGPWVICTPGGPKATIAAIDKKDGRLVLGLARRRSGRLCLGHQGDDRRLEAVCESNAEGRDRRGRQGRQVPLALRRPGQPRGQLLGLSDLGRYGFRRQRLRQRRRIGEGRSCRPTDLRQTRSISARK